MKIHSKHFRAREGDEVDLGFGESSTRQRNPRRQFFLHLPKEEQSPADRMQTVVDAFDTLEMRYPATSAERRRELLSIRWQFAK